MQDARCRWIHTCPISQVSLAKTFARTEISNRWPRRHTGPTRTLGTLVLLCSPSASCFRISRCGWCPVTVIEKAQLYVGHWNHSTLSVSVMLVKFLVIIAFFYAWHASATYSSTMGLAALASMITPQPNKGLHAKWHKPGASFSRNLTRLEQPMWSHARGHAPSCIRHPLNEPTEITARLDPAALKRKRNNVCS